MLDSRRFSNDRATTVPPACAADDREIAAGCGDRGILETSLRKILAYFPASCGYFPNKFICLTQRQKLLEITSLYNGRIGTWFATAGEERSNRSSTHSL